MEQSGGPIHCGRLLALPGLSSHACPIRWPMGCAAPLPLLNALKSVAGWNQKPLTSMWGVLQWSWMQPELQTGARTCAFLMHMGTVTVTSEGREGAL